MFVRLSTTTQLEKWNLTRFSTRFCSLFSTQLLENASTCFAHFPKLSGLSYTTHILKSLLPISGIVLDEKFQRNASKFAIFYIGIRRPKVAFSVFHFVQLYILPIECRANFEGFRWNILLSTKNLFLKSD